MNRIPSALVRIEIAAALAHEPELDVLRAVLGVSSAIGTRADSAIYRPVRV